MEDDSGSGNSIAPANSWLQAAIPAGGKAAAAALEPDRGERIAERGDQPGGEPSTKWASRPTGTARVTSTTPARPSTRPTALRLVRRSRSATAATAAPKSGVVALRITR